MSDKESTSLPVKKRGRPRKTELAKNSKGGRGQVGRPKGDAAKINEYKARMLASPKSNKVLESIFDAALNDEHPNQSAAWKIITDRIMPKVAFEQEFAQSGGKGAIQINITGLQANTSETIDAEDADFTEVSND